MQLHDTGATYPEPAGENEARPVYRWYHKLGAVAASVFCFELGAFLLIYPWISDWNVSAAWLPVWSRDVWTSAYLRGAVSGLGMLNLYISVVEVFRLRRFSG
jgi:hypothetical protein